MEATGVSGRVTRAEEALVGNREVSSAGRRPTWPTRVAAQAERAAVEVPPPAARRDRAHRAQGDCAAAIGAQVRRTPTQPSGERRPESGRRAALAAHTLTQALADWPKDGAQPALRQALAGRQPPPAAGGTTMREQWEVSSGRGMPAAPTLNVATGSATAPQRNRTDERQRRPRGGVQDNRAQERAQQSRTDAGARRGKRGARKRADTAERTGGSRVWRQEIARKQNYGWDREGEQQGERGRGEEATDRIAVGR